MPAPFLFAAVASRHRRFTSQMLSCCGSRSPEGAQAERDSFLARQHLELHGLVSPSRSPAPWALDGMPPKRLKNARTLAAHVLADAKLGRTERIRELLDSEDLDLEHSSALLAATDLSNGDTALMLAVAHGHVDTCAVLLERGADPFARNRHRQTAGDLARRYGHSEIAEMLCEGKEEALLLMPAAFSKEQPAAVDEPVPEWLTRGVRTLSFGPQTTSQPPRWLVHGVRALSFSTRRNESPCTPEKPPSQPPEWLTSGIRALSFGHFGTQPPGVDQAAAHDDGCTAPTPPPRKCRHDDFNPAPLPPSPRHSPHGDAPPPPPRRKKRVVSGELRELVNGSVPRELVAVGIMPPTEELFIQG